MINELRIYETVPGGLPALNEYFAKYTLDVFEKHGIRSFGYWTEEVGTSNRLVYILEFDDLAQRTDAWNSFRSDPDWKPSGLTVQIHNTILLPTDYSPKNPTGGDGWIYELRQYDTEPGHIPALNERFANITMGLFEKHGIRNIGYWTEEIGVNNRLDYIVAYESWAARETSRKGFQEDPEWQEAVKNSQAAGRPIIKKIRNTLLKPTSFSPLR